MATIPASENVFPEILLAEVAAPAAAATGQVRLYVKADGLLYWKDDAGTEYAVSSGDLAAHLADTGDAHDASAISIVDAGTLYTATDVEAALAEVMAAVGAGGIPATIFDAQGDLIVASAADTAARLALGANGTVLTSNGTTAAWAAPAVGGDAVINRLTSGDVTISATTNVFASNITGLGDITLAAASGDFIEAGISAIFNNATAQSGKFDVCTVVAGAAVNFFSNGTGTGGSNGLSGWYCVTSSIQKASGSVGYIAQAGDISGGNIVLRLLCFVSASNRVLSASSTLPLIFWAKNHGQ